MASGDLKLWPVRVPERPKGARITGNEEYVSFNYRNLGILIILYRLKKLYNKDTIMDIYFMF